MIGLRAGRKNWNILSKCASRLLLWTFVTGLIFSAGYLICLPFISSMLTDSMSVNSGVSDLTLWVALIPIISCWAFIYDGLYIGITDTFTMMISTLAGGIIFFGIISINYFSTIEIISIYGNRIIWTAFLTYLGARGIYLAFRWKFSLDNLKSQACTEI